MYNISRFLFRGAKSLFEILKFYSKYLTWDWIIPLETKTSPSQISTMQETVTKERQNLIRQNSQNIRKGSLAEESEDKLFKIKFTEDFLKKREQLENIYKEEDRKRENLQKDFNSFVDHYKISSENLLGKKSGDMIEIQNIILKNRKMVKKEEGVEDDEREEDEQKSLQEEKSDFKRQGFERSLKNLVSWNLKRVKRDQEGEALKEKDIAKVVRKELWKSTDDEEEEDLERQIVGKIKEESHCDLSLSESHDSDSDLEKIGEKFSSKEVETVLKTQTEKPTQEDSKMKIDRSQKVSTNKFDLQKFHMMVKQRTQTKPDLSSTNTQIKNLFTPNPQPTPETPNFNLIGAPLGKLKNFLFETQPNTEILSFLFNSENSAKPNIDLWKGKIRYGSEINLKKITRQYDIYMQDEIIKFKNRIKEKQNVKIREMSTFYYLDFEAPAKYLIRVKTMIRLEKKDLLRWKNLKSKGNENEMLKGFDLRGKKNISSEKTSERTNKTLETENPKILESDIKSQIALDKEKKNHQTENQNSKNNSEQSKNPKSDILKISVRNSLQSWEEDEIERQIRMMRKKIDPRIGLMNGYLERLKVRNTYLRQILRDFKFAGPNLFWKLSVQQKKTEFWYILDFSWFLDSLDQIEFRINDHQVF